MACHARDAAVQMTHGKLSSNTYSWTCRKRIKDFAMEGRRVNQGHSVSKLDFWLSPNCEPYNKNILSVEKINERWVLVKLVSEDFLSKKVQ